jgi:hypothetical protein
VEGVQAMRRNRPREIATFGGGFRERQLTVCAHEAGGRRHNHSDVDVYTHKRAASRSGRIRVVSLHREHDLPRPDSGPQTETITFDFPAMRPAATSLRFRWGTVVVPLEITVGGNPTQ